MILNDTGFTYHQPSNYGYFEMIECPVKKGQIVSFKGFGIASDSKKMVVQNVLKTNTGWDISFKPLEESDDK